MLVAQSPRRQRYPPSLFDCCVCFVLALLRHFYHATVAVDDAKLLLPHMPSPKPPSRHHLCSVGSLQSPSCSSALAPLPPPLPPATSRSCHRRQHHHHRCHHCLIVVFVFTPPARRCHYSLLSRAVAVHAIVQSRRRRRRRRLCTPPAYFKG